MVCCIQSAAELLLRETLLRGIEKHGADVNDRLARWVAWFSAISVCESPCCVEWGMFSVIVVMCLIGGVLFSDLIRGFLATCDKH